jgi:fructose-bisphosphate aldolase class II
MMENVAKLLQEARDGGYAIGAFNVLNLETTHAVLDAAKETDSPVIVQFTESTMNYIGGRAIFQSIKNLAEWYYPDVRVGIHLDHGKSLEIVERCVAMGVPSIMYDGSRQRLEDNIAMTKRAVELCRKNNASIQGELGSVPYVGERAEFADKDWDKYMTNPEEAEMFVRETGVDTLAVAIGNAHGMARERSVPDYERLEMIAEKVSVPLVMHGASDWDEARVREVIKRGVSCFNVDTNSRVAFVASLAHSMKDFNGTNFDVRKILGDARRAMKESVKEKIVMFRGK